MKEKKKHDFYFIETLQLIFITLRLCNVITWNWILVLSPLIGSLTFCLIIVLIGMAADKAKRKNIQP